MDYKVDNYNVYNRNNNNNNNSNNLLSDYSSGSETEHISLLMNSDNIRLRLSIGYYIIILFIYLVVF